jgi:hypothetical protein
VKPISDFHSCSVSLEFTRTDGVYGNHEIVQTAWTGKSRIQRRVQHALGLSQQGFGVFRGKKLYESFGRAAGPPRKQPVKMKLADLGDFRERPKIRLFEVVFVEVADYFFDSFIVGHAATLVDAHIGFHPILAPPEMQNSGYRSQNPLNGAPLPARVGG